MTPDDPFTWWEDKQVAIVVRGDVVRGWVLTCRHHPGPTDERAAGRMTVVLLISDPGVAASYPDTVVNDVLDDGEHGQPRNVRGLWHEDDLADVHPAPRPEGRLIYNTAENTMRTRDQRRYGSEV